MTKPDLLKAREAYYQASDGVYGLLGVVQGIPSDDELRELVTRLNLALDHIHTHLSENYNWD